MQETIGARISAARKAKGFSQEKLAEMLGVSSQAVSKWENDLSCPDIALLPQLVKALDMTADELLTGKKDEVRMVPPAQRKPFDELTFRIRVNTVAGDRIRVNLPMPLVKVCMELGTDAMIHMGDKSDTLKNLDMQKIVDMVEMGLLGKLVEVESAEGDIVEVIVE